MSVGVDIIKGTCFTARSGDKAASGELARTSTFVAQGANTVKAYGQTGFVGAKAAQSVTTGIANIAQGKGIAANCAKGVLWAQNHVNPLVGVCVGANIIFAEDKEKAFCEGVPGFMGMLAAENGFKALAKSDKGKTILNSIETWGTKVGKSGKVGKCLAVAAEGLGFVAASIGGYTGAAKIGGSALEYERSQRRKRCENFNAVC